MTAIQVFDIVYLTALMAILVGMLVLSIIRSRNDQKILKILVEVSAKNAESVEQSVKATQSAINLLNEVIHHGHTT